jgi:membrane protein
MNIKLLTFLKQDLWLIKEQDFPTAKALYYKSLKVLVLAVQGFSSDLCALRASALSLYSLLSIVPIIAMLFGIAKGFGFEDRLQQQLLTQIPHQEKMILQLIGFARNMLDSTPGGVVAGVGIIVLFWSVINVISNIEESFNFIWKIEEPRVLGRKFSDYLSLMLLAPVMLITAGSIAVLLETEVKAIIDFIGLPVAVALPFIQALKIIPVLLVSGLFTFMFIFMPNRQVQIIPGVIAGAFTGIFYSLIQWIYINLQIGVSSYNTIYGSFAALPLFIIWLQITWLAVLFGCELAFFWQNYENYRNSDRFANLSFYLKKNLALHIAHLIVKNFTAEKKPQTAAEIATQLNIPLSVAQSLLQKLKNGNIVAVLDHPEDQDLIYQPARDINKLTLAEVINTLEQCGDDDIPESHQNPKIVEATEHFKNLVTESEQNFLLKDL